MKRRKKKKAGRECGTFQVPPHYQKGYVPSFCPLCTISVSGVTDGIMLDSLLILVTYTKKQPTERLMRHRLSHVRGF